MIIVKSKLFILSILAILLNNFFSFSQVKDCDITFLDSNSVRKSISKVSLNSFRSDTIKFSTVNSIYKLSLQNLVRLGYTTDPNPQTGMLIGAAIGLSVGAVILLFVGD